MLSERLNRGRTRGQRALLLAIGSSTLILIAEVIGGILTGSLALLADAGHMTSDVTALGLSLGALWLASMPSTFRRTYGLQRAEVLAALANSLALIAIAGVVFWQASRRLADPPDVEAGPMLAVATIGLLANILAALLLLGHRKGSLNIRSAFLHVVGDGLSSVGVIAAGLIMLATGAFIADPFISVFIGILILISALRITWESTQVLLEAVPAGLDTAALQEQMLAVRGVKGVHDLHIWTVTSGFISMSAHVETDQSRDQHDILVDLRRLLALRFGIEHATLQLETRSLHDELEACCHVDVAEEMGHEAVTS